MAGAGYKLFSTGDVLSASDVNTYLQQQTVMVFASAAARTTALASVLAEGMVTYLKDTDSTEYYNGSAWIGIGTSPLTTKGDLYTYSTTNARLGVGTNGQFLKADSTTATGLAWGIASANLTLTQIATGNTSSGTTVTISGLSNYDTIIVLWSNATLSTAQYLYARPNSDASAPNYKVIASNIYGTNGLAGFNTSTSGINLTALSQAAATTQSQLLLTMTNCKASGFTNFTSLGGYYAATAAYSMAWGSGIYTVANPISTLDLYASGATFTGGTYTVWGG